ncbi:hypothetical protein HanRHA438_Chr04g0165921 [Helianthus annuus]|nr:hypothetical protein HanRHA438_Chr04g0165921 [Helianthus annuus]
MTGPTQSHDPPVRPPATGPTTDPMLKRLKPLTRPALVTGSRPDRPARSGLKNIAL